MTNETYTNRNNLWQTPALVIVMTGLAAIFLMGIGSVVAKVITSQMGVDVQQLVQSETPIDLSLQERQGVRIFNLLAHLLGFTGGALLIAFLTRGQEKNRTFLALDRWPTLRVFLLALVALAGSAPLILFSNWLNYQLPLPEWMWQTEGQQNHLVAQVLRTENALELITAFAVAALAPAVGEELLFRGILQPQFQKWAGNAHIGIWLTAAVFSAIHLQFAGFLPRMLLGAFLGYTLWWSRSLWLPILLHLFFNGVQVVAAFLSPAAFETASQENPVEMPSLLLVLGSLVALYFLLPLLARHQPPAAEEDALA
ncbi:MAG: CPBP family intramembrane glutamic endopeptidase [Saprospiraceae bacterium]